jgi:transcriptional regulator with PAS, ATPase and Fis domain
MINWKEIKGLHVIAKLDEIIAKWFNVELFWADENGHIKSGQFDEGYNSKNNFSNVQLKMAYGSEYFDQDVEKMVTQFKESNKDSFVYDSFFPNVKGFAARINIDGEFKGLVFAYPIVLDSVMTQEYDSIVKKMVECGAKLEDAKNAVAHLKRVTTKENEYLHELVSLVSEEIGTFHQEISKREDRIHELNSELGEKYRYHAMIGKSKKMQQIYRLLEKISSSESSVFIQGENGTGKELVAKAIHYYSPRKEQIFLAVNCSAFNDNLLESELFGHVKGSFTGAIKDKKGVFEQAHGGTLFLDEIGDTSLSMQVKLLRVLQDGTYIPVGGIAPKKCDVRIVCATNKNIKEMMSKGEFREDLFYRINVINVGLPSLKERKEDIPVLVDHFMQKRCEESGLPQKVLSKKCLEKMLDYAWPGNVRELENEIERLVVLAGEDKTILPEHLSPRISDAIDAANGGGTSSGGAYKGLNTNGTMKDAMEGLEILMIGEGLKRTGFNKSKLAKELDISRASLIMKVEKYELDKRKKAVGEE